MTLLGKIKAHLRLRGYVEVEPSETGGGVWRCPDGSVDKIVPMVIDCFERETEDG